MTHPLNTFLCLKKVSWLLILIVKHYSLILRNLRSSSLDLRKVIAVNTLLFVSEYSQVAFHAGIVFLEITAFIKTEFNGKHLTCKYAVSLYNSLRGGFLSPSDFDYTTFVS